MAYNGSSIVDYLNSVGQASDYSTRSKLAGSKGIQNYTGTADQNTQLLNILRGGGGATAPAPTVNPVAQPTYNAPAPSAPSAPANNYSVNPAPASNGQPNFDQVFGTLYKGWDRQSALNDFNAGGWKNKAGAEQFTSGGSGVSSTFGLGNQPTINLQSVYDSALTDAGVNGLQSQYDEVQGRIDARKKALADATAKINDNPFYSEATRVGRIAKLNQAAEGDINNLIGEATNAQTRVSSAKADAQVKLNIASQQYNIQSAQYQQNLQLFNSLLSNGSLNNASSEDVSQIAMTTGLSTTMVQSIISSAKARENKPQLITVDDGSNQKIVAVDPSGNIVSTQVLGPSLAKATGASTGNPNNPGGGAYTPSQYSKAVDILKTNDVVNQKGNTKKADKLLAPWEVEASITQLMSFLGGDVNKAADLLALAMNSEGYGQWNPPK